jgi:hypothetical protein
MTLPSSRFQINAERFSIENGWLLLDGPSIKISSISSIVVIRNNDDIKMESVKKEMASSRAGSMGCLLWAIVVFVIPYSLVYLGFTIEKVHLAVWLLSYVFIFYLSSIAIERAIKAIHKVEYTKIYELLVTTNSGSEFFFLSSDVQYLHRVKETLEESIRMIDTKASYYFNIKAHRIEKIDANVNNVTNSPGAAVIGGQAMNVTQSTNVTIHGMQDVSQLISLVEQSNSVNKANMKECLETIRDHLAGGVSTKAQAKTAWQEFVVGVGSLAGAGNHIWELVGRVASLLP